MTTLISWSVLWSDYDWVHQNIIITFHRKNSDGHRRIILPSNDRQNTVIQYNVQNVKKYKMIKDGVNQYRPFIALANVF